MAFAMARTVSGICWVRRSYFFIAKYLVRTKCETGNAMPLHSAKIKLTPFTKRRRKMRSPNAGGANLCRLSFLKKRSIHIEVIIFEFRNHLRYMSRQFVRIFSLGIYKYIIYFILRGMEILFYLADMSDASFALYVTFLLNDDIYTA